jgi:hypothetical protein
MFGRILVSSIISAMSLVASAEQVVAAQGAHNPSIGRFLGAVVYNGTNTECTIYANPVMAVGPIYGLVNLNGGLMNAWYYNCHEMRQNRTERGLFDGYGRSTCPAANPGPVYCPAVVDPIFEACADAGGEVVGCPGTCITLCTVPVTRR